VREIRYDQALNEAIREEMTRDESIFLIGEDIAFGGIFGVYKDLVKEFGEKRARQTPIAESAIVGISVGAAITGLRPIAEIMYVDFALLAMDQIVNQAAKLRFMSGGKIKIPLVIRTQGGSGTSEAAQHSQSLEAFFTHTPGLKVAMPSTPYDAKGLLKSSIRDDSPVIFIEHKLLYTRKGPVPDEEYLVPLGEADVKRHGEDITVVAYSLMLHKALEAAQKLSNEVSVEVIDPRTLSPLDIDTIVGSVKRTGRLLVVHEAWTSGGFGAEIVRQVVERAFDHLDSQPQVLGGVDVPAPFAKILETASIPQTEDIVKAILMS